MRRISLLLLLAVFAVGCASSTTVLGEPATELARVDDTVEPAPTPTSVIDPDWAEPARPIEPVATPEPTPTPEPVVLQLPDRDGASTAEDSEPTAEAEPAEETEPDDPADANEEDLIEFDAAYQALAADSIAALANSQRVDIVVERYVGPGDQNDYSSTTAVTIDRLANLRAGEVSMVGAGWDGFATRNGLGRLRTGEHYDFLISDETSYLSASPALSALPSGAAWLAAPTVNFADEQRTQLGVVVLTDPQDVVTSVIELLRQPGRLRTTSDGSYVVDVSNADILRVTPGSATLSLVALDQILSRDPDITAFTETTPVRVVFADGVLNEMTIDFGPLFAELSTATEITGFDGIEISETYTFSFGGDAVLSLPAETAVEYASSTADLIGVGVCFGLEGEPSSCREPHLWEVMATARLDAPVGAAYPGDTQLLEQTGPACTNRIEEMLGIDLNTTQLVVDVQVPTETEWKSRQRQYACVLKFAQPVEQPAREIDFEGFQTKASRLDLQVGQCIQDEGLDRLLFSVVDCEEPHYYEVILRFTVDSPSGQYPGADAVFEQADLRCVTEIESRVSGFDLRLEWQVQAMLPSAQTWIELGERDVICVTTTEQLESGRAFGTSSEDATDE